MQDYIVAGTQASGITSTSLTPPLPANRQNEGARNFYAPWQQETAALTTALSQSSSAFVNK